MTFNSLLIQEETEAMIDEKPKNVQETLNKLVSEMDE